MTDNINDGDKKTSDTVANNTKVPAKNQDDVDTDKKLEETLAEKTETAIPGAEGTVVEETTADAKTADTEDDAVQVDVKRVVVADGENSLVKADKFDETQLATATTMANDLVWTDTNAILLYGSDPQKNLSEFLDTLLDGISAKDAGPVGDLTISSAKGIEMTKIKEFQAQTENGKSFLAKIPLIGRYFDYAKIFMGRQSSFKNLIAQILKTAEERKANLIRRNNELDSLFAQNLVAQDDMALCLVSAEYALQLGQAKFNEMKLAADESNDPQDRNLAQDMGNALSAFQVRYADMKTAYLRAMVYGPQIRTVQEAIKIELQNIVASVLNDLTALKQAVVMAAANYSTMQAQAERNARSNAVKEIENLNATLTNQAYTSAKESQGRSLDDAKHLAEIAQKTLATLERGAEIDAENKKKMAEANDILVQAKTDLLAGMEKMQAQITS